MTFGRKSVLHVIAHCGSSLQQRGGIPLQRKPLYPYFYNNIFWGEGGYEKSLATILSPFFVFFLVL